jgi:hypothetical protein
LRSSKHRGTRMTVRAGVSTRNSLDCEKTRTGVPGSRRGRAAPSRPPGLDLPRRRYAGSSSTNNGYEVEGS